jgi:cytoskeletal protein CcmA (bactofilin family)
MSKAKEWKGEINAFLGPGSELEGKLHFTGSVRLDGRVTGQISSQGLLIIGPAGRIQADVQVDSIIICGEFRGEVTARERVEMRPPATVYGTVATPSLIIHEGVLFEGACRMTNLSQPAETTEGAPAKVAFLSVERVSQAG